MPSKISFFNKGVFFNNIKRFWLIAFAYSFILLMFVMGYLSTSTSRLRYAASAEVLPRIGLDIFSHSAHIMTVLLGLFSLAAGVAVFSYIHFQKNTAMMHSLPLRRETLFITNYLSGIVLVVFPLLFNGAVLIISEAAMGFPRIDSAIAWVGINLVITFLLYTFTVFAGMFTGHMAAQAIFFLIYNFLALFLEVVINFVFSNFFFGYSNSSNKFEAWSPLYHIEELYSGFYRDQGNFTTIAGYFAASVIFLVCSYLLYRKRNMETASDVISLQIVKPIFKYAVTSCASALLGTIS